MAALDKLRMSFCRLAPQMRSFTRICTVRCHARRLLLQNSIISSKFHTTGRRLELMEFFDDTDNWKKDEVQVGRPWKLDELRIKSNSDLHKLWYVLLKERNMLMTMEQLYEDEYRPMPSPERMEKVDESMDNLLEVVRERNMAVNELETGKSGEPEVRTVLNFMGIPEERTVEEHIVPQSMNPRYQMMYTKYQPWMKEYHRLNDEQVRNRESSLNRQLKKRREELLEKFPDLSEEDLEHGLEDVREKFRY